MFGHKFEILFQLDSADCGPTCLRMIANHYGKKISSEELRQLTYYHRTGVSLLAISDAAEKLGFKTLAGETTFEKLLEINLPCILHWNEEHFVVLYSVGPNSAKIADPSGGLLSYSKDDFIKIWAKGILNEQASGIVLLLEPTDFFYTIATSNINLSKNGFGYVSSYIWKYKWLIGQLMLGLLVASGIQMVFPFLMRLIVDNGVQYKDISLIYLILGGQLILFFGSISLQFIRRMILVHVSARVSIAIVSDFISKLLALPLSFYNARKTGDILQRIEDHERIERFLTNSSSTVLFSVFTSIVMGFVLFLYSTKVFLVFFIFSLVYFLFVVRFLNERSKIDYKKFSEMAVSRSNMIEIITGMPEIKLNNCQRLKRNQWERIQAKLFLLNLDSTKILQYQETGTLFLQELKNILITFITAKSVIEGEMSLGTMLSIQFISGQLNVPLHDFINFSIEWQDAKLSLERIVEVKSFADEERTASLPFSLVSQGTAITISSLTFHYDGPNSPKVLENVDISIPLGKVTAIVGSSGSGKTTLLKLLLKFFPPTGGCILIGDQDLTDISTSSWRSKCGVVMQDGFIFSDTVINNITISEEAPDLDKLQQAVNIANISSFIESLPLGFNTKIGESGVGLSAGQKQRMLIARAVYKNPEFIFFDEATSALDARNERIIIENLRNFFKGRTVIVIAHRLSTVRDSDQIIVLDQGRVVESGTHERLTSSKGEYYRLVQNQLEL